MKGPNKTCTWNFIY